jgi:hypothetical protein
MMIKRFLPIHFLIGKFNLIFTHLTFTSRVMNSGEKGENKEGNLRE